MKGNLNCNTKMPDMSNLPILEIKEKLDCNESNPIPAYMSLYVCVITVYI